MKLKKTQITLIVLPLTACAMMKPLENLFIAKIDQATEKILCQKDKKLVKRNPENSSQEPLVPINATLKTASCEAE